MRNHLFWIILSLLASKASAMPVTYVFGGEVDSIDLRSLATGKPLVPNPNVPLVVDGKTVFNGDSRVFGLFTFDDEFKASKPGCAHLPLSYRLQTEGVVFTKAAAVGCSDQFHQDSQGISWHVEESGLGQSRGPTSSIQDFSFNFERFFSVDGSFSLGYMFGDGMIGSGIKGQIDTLIRLPFGLLPIEEETTGLNLARTMITSVPEPSVFPLLLVSLLMAAVASQTLAKRSSLQNGC